MLAGLQPSGSVAAGQLTITGAVVSSFQLTTCVQLALLPPQSVAVYVIVRVRLHPLVASTCVLLTPTAVHASVAVTL